MLQENISWCTGCENCIGQIKEGHENGKLLYRICSKEYPEHFGAKCPKKLIKKGE